MLDHKLIEQLQLLACELHMGQTRKDGPSRKNLVKYLDALKMLSDTELREIYGK